MRNSHYIRICCLLFAVLASALQAATSSAAVINVPASYPTIQAGINAAAAGDTVLVASGTYTGPGNRNLSFGGKNIVLVSASGASVTIIDCQALGAGFVLGASLDHTAVIDGFTITNGRASTGAGISVRDQGSPTIRNCTISGNTAVKFGGGLFVSDGSLASFTNCTIEGNHALRGGGVRVGDKTAASFVDCTIAANTATLGGGGVIANDDSASTFTSCIIEGNQAQEGGGLLLTDASFPALEGSTITGNVATNGGGFMITAGSSVTVTGCTIAANRATSNGGGMYVGTVLSAPVTRTIVWSNCANLSGDDVYTTAGASLSFECSDVGPGVEGNGSVVYDANTLHVDPLFCKEFLCTTAPTAAGEYTLDDDSQALAANSPCGQLIGAQPQGCTTRTFDVTMQGQYNKIQDAIDRTVSGVGDFVEVDDDTWTGPRNTELNFNGKSIVLKSKNGPQNAVIDGGNSVRAIVFNNGEDNTSVVEGFTFTRGAATLPGSSVLVDGGSSPVIRNCKIKQNDGDEDVVLVMSGNPKIEACTIEDNAVGNSGAAAVALLGGTPTLESCVIQNNAAPNAVRVATAAVISGTLIVDNHGGGVHFESSLASVIEDSDISRNQSRGVVLDNAAADFNGVIFQQNGGGGVEVTGLGSGAAVARSGGVNFLPTAPTTFTNCEFSGHSTDRGAGFFLSCTNEPEIPYVLTFTNCQFTGNHATFEGGAVAICGRATVADILPVFNNCTIAANSAQNGGGIYMGVTQVGIGREARALVEETILWGNCSTTGTQGEAFVAASNEIGINCSHSDLDEIAGGGVTESNNVTSGIPNFCDYPGLYNAPTCDTRSTIEGDFDLSPSSPAAPQQHPCGPNQIGAFPVVNCIPTAIGDTPGTVVRTALRPPVPNPFNPSTSVEFTLEKASHVTLRIYDVAGRLARTLVDRPLTRGVHQEQWDGRDDRGNPAASGVYFLRFRAGNVKQTQKMVLLK